MNSVIQRIILQHILDGTKDGAIDLNETRDNLVITEEALQSIVEQLKKDGLISVKGDLVIANVDQRIELAVMAIKNGADFKKVSKNLR